MEWKLQLIAFALYLVMIIGGFLLIPKEPLMFGMVMIPGPLDFFSRFGLPMLATIGIGVAVFRKSKFRKRSKTAIFFVGSIFVWVLAFVLFN